jgi:uncharacterized protein YoxC
MIILSIIGGLVAVAAVVLLLAVCLRVQQLDKDLTELSKELISLRNNVARYLEVIAKTRPMEGERASKS